MQKIQRDIIEKFLSAERLNKYTIVADGNHERAVDLYLENLNKCQNLYIKLHWLEVGLRNTINRQFLITYGSNWFDNPKISFEEIELQKIRKTKEILNKERKIPNNSNMVSTLSFGFWVNLFNSPYEKLWRICLHRAFIYDGTPFDRKELRKKLHPILKLRNRIAHYEPIIINHDLPKLEQYINDIIYWIEPNMKGLI